MTIFCSALSLPTGPFWKKGAGGLKPAGRVIVDRDAGNPDGLSCTSLLPHWGDTAYWAGGGGDKGHHCEMCASQGRGSWGRSVNPARFWPWRLRTAVWGPSRRAGHAPCAGPPFPAAARGTASPGPSAAARNPRAPGEASLCPPVVAQADLNLSKGENKSRSLMCETVT